jgi:small ligand-binding sensory domain FIST
MSAEVVGTSLFSYILANQICSDLPVLSTAPNPRAMPNAAASRLILSRFSESLVTQTAREALQEIGGKVSLGIVFCSADYQPHLEDFLEILQLHAHIPLLVGSSGSGLIGAGAEAENASGFSLLLLHLPETALHPFAFSAADAPDWDDAPAWRKFTGNSQVDAWITLGDPSGMPVEPWLGALGRAYPGIPCIGGLASGGRDGDEMFVFHNRTLIENGAVMVGLRGGVKLHTIVSQGCRPIGEPLPVTAGDQNLVRTIGSRPAYTVLDAAFQALSEKERELAKGNLFAGLAMREDRDEFHRGDFLIRNILGADEASGIVALGAFPRIGQTIQFQLRDAKTADEDLRHLAAAIAAEGVKPIASLVFSCGGRGRHLFNSANHDAGILAEYFADHPSAGFFCNGEIGPIGHRNYIHGYTASILLFS